MLLSPTQTILRPEYGETAVPRMVRHPVRDCPIQTHHDILKTSSNLLIIKYICHSETLEKFGTVFVIIALNGEIFHAQPKKSAMARHSLIFEDHNGQGSTSGFGETWTRASIVNISSHLAGALRFLVRRSRRQWRSGAISPRMIQGKCRFRDKASHT